MIENESSDFIFCNFKAAGLWKGPVISYVLSFSLICIYFLSAALKLLVFRKVLSYERGGSSTTIVCFHKGLNLLQERRCRPGPGTSESGFLKFEK